MRLSNEVVEQLARVRCPECGEPSIYPDKAFMAHHLEHYADWSSIRFDRHNWVNADQTYFSYKEYGYREVRYASS